MDFRDSPDEAAFREQLRAWIPDNLPAGWGKPGYQEPEGEDRLALYKDWSRRLYEAGYVGTHWPKRYGGFEQPLSYAAITLEELAEAEAPEHIGLIGIGMAGPTIIAHGTEEQQERFLKNILTGEEVWCQGFSEPGAGSDLASLQTKAEPDGDGWRVTGQKVWSSFAHIADWCILVARTDPDVPKHQGLTYFLMDMHAPGVEVRPLRQITGDAEFNEIFMQDVHIPANRVLAEPGQGWQVAITTLMNERANVGFALLARMDVSMRRLVGLAQNTSRNGGRAADDPLVRDRLADLWIDLQGLRFTIYRSFSALLKRGVPGPEGSGAKLFWSEANQRLTKFAVEIEGTSALLAPGSDRVTDNGRWQIHQLRTRGNTIEAGTSEILRNIIAERVLGLPKSSR
ncbi:MAG TPA: acyl-CoA dehydrogenase family protein [Actinomycetota bacterium]|nr:acyl-CoA dehydrogenase family protein [Actinomycetota bacterium]